MILYTKHYVAKKKSRKSEHHNPIVHISFRIFKATLIKGFQLEEIFYMDSIAPYEEIC